MHKEANGHAPMHGLLQDVVGATWCNSQQIFFTLTLISASCLALLRCLCISARPPSGITGTVKPHASTSWNWLQSEARLIHQVNHSIGDSCPGCQTGRGKGRSAIAELLSRPARTCRHKAAAGKVPGAAGGRSALQPAAKLGHLCSGSMLCFPAGRARASGGCPAAPSCPARPAPLHTDPAAVVCLGRGASLADTAVSLLWASSS
jgi:hypothetical protein